MMTKYCRLSVLSIGVIIVLNLCNTHKTNASVIFFTNEVNWISATTNLEVFSFTSENMEKADEVPNPPLPEDDLTTTTLTFRSSNTQLARDFTLTALSKDHTWNFEDRGVSNFLSPGDIDRVFDPTLSNLEDDDFDVEITSSLPMTAFAFNLLGNDIQLVPVTESFAVFGPGGVLLGSTPLPVTGPFEEIFLGVIADSPIEKLSIIEDADGGDNIGIRNFRFGTAVRVPEPSTLVLFLTSLAVLYSTLVTARGKV